MNRFAASNLFALRRALEHHNADCPRPAAAILLNPVDHALLGFHRLWGVPVLADDRIPVKRIRIDCDGSAWLAEEELQEWASSTERAHESPT